ncbi:hypothetical protein ACO2I3_16050 [Leptospira interrogans]
MTLTKFMLTLRALYFCSVIIASLFAVQTVAVAQTPAAKPVEATGGLAIPTGAKQSLMIRTTLIAVSQANATGNYSVLRELGSAGFQMANTPARLTEVFGELRRRKIDLTPVLYYEPKLVRPPSFDENRRLRLTGLIDSRPEQVNFDMLFENVAGDWRLFGIAVKLQPVPAPQPQSPISEKRTAPDTKPAAVASDGLGGLRKSGTPSGWGTSTKASSK